MRRGGFDQTAGSDPWVRVTDLSGAEAGGGSLASGPLTRVNLGFGLTGGTGILALSPAHPADGLGLLQPCTFPFADKIRMLLQYRLNVPLKVFLESFEHLLEVIPLGHPIASPLLRILVNAATSLLPPPPLYKSGRYHKSSRQ
jgi:hypothetical protein